MDSILSLHLVYNTKQYIFPHTKEKQYTSKGGKEVVYLALPLCYSS